MKKAFQLFVPVIVILAMMLSFVPAHPVQAVSADIVISQVYGGGGNSGATYQNDFVELFNRGTATVSLDGWSIQYASSTGTGLFAANSGQLTPLSGSIAPGQYFLVQEASNAAVGALLPTPDLTDSSPIALAAGAGKVALVNTITPLGCNGSTASPCSPAALATIVDLAGYGNANFFEGAGPAPTISAILADFRINGGCTDTDNNSADFSAATPAPRNTASPLNVCGGEPTPTNPSAIGSATPNTLFTGDAVLLTLAVTPGTIPTSTGLAASCDLSSIGGAADQAFFDDGTNGDVTASDNTFSFSTTVASTTSSGAKSFACTITDAEGRTGSASIGLNVTQIIPIGAVNGAVSDTEDATTHRSPFAPASGNGTGSTVVTVQGVVYEKTLQASSSPYGLFIQNTTATADGDPNTSDGLFVYMGKYANIMGPSGYYIPQVGDELILSGKISEYYNMTEMSSSLKILKIVRSGVDIDAEIAPAVASPTADLAIANRYWERQQGMRIQVPQNSIVLGGRNVFSPADAEVWVAAPDSTVAQRTDPYTRRAFRDAHPLDDNYDPTAWDGNGYRILMGSWGLKAVAGDSNVLIDPARTFDTVTNIPAGGLNYTYSKYRIEITDQPTYAEGVDPSQNNPVQEIVDRTTAYSIVDYNLENLYDFRNNPFSGCDFAGDTGCPAVSPFIDKVSSPYNYVPASLADYQARVHDIALQIIDDLHSPDVLMVQEVENQDFCSVTDGALTCGSTDNADGRPDVLQDLAIEIAALGGPSYDSAFDRDSSDLRGIAPAYLYRTDRVELLPAVGDPILGMTPTIDYAGAGVAANSDVSNPKTFNAVLPAGVTACETSWVFPRAASVALFRIFSDSVGIGTFTDVYTINNHFKSGPDTCVAHRTEQAKYNAALIAAIEAFDPLAQIVTGGDLNVYPRPDDIALGATDQLGSLYDPMIGLKNLWEVLLGQAPESAYSYVYLGMAQTLDQMFVNQPLLNTLQDFKIAHINSDFPADYPGDVARGTSDHDPNAATFMLAHTESFINGSGWFKSTVDGYKAKFDIVSMYKKDTNVPEGETMLLLGKDTTFLSTSYESLAVLGSTAVLKGKGTINGTGDYNFIITVKDGSPDQIKVMIWDTSTILYNTNTLINLGGGNISIH